MNFKKYHILSEQEKLDYVKSIENKIPSNLSFDSFGINSVPVYSLKNTEMRFSLIFGEQFYLGISEEEIEKILKIEKIPNITFSELKPRHEVEIKTCLVLNRPILNIDINKDLIKIDSEPYHPFFSEIEIAKKICKSHGARIAEEKEWEYFCRAGRNNQLFTFGDEIPKTSELEKWLSWNFKNPDEIKYNDYSLSGLFFGEWCDSFFTVNHDANSEKIDSYTIKGGGAYFWPWQDQEWVWCLTAMRMPSSDLIENKAVFRMVIDLKE